ncbi:hypothetical protein F7734_41900 [Scytonema sp. UIC 10036]|uniref:hypothetical protein n=1 Tax=Scytonema sp. UIC 10036 TaxID=2304196 RepID=UPI0012DAC1AB|nr:hypothetical protein [Scytonema sp. UIC 10036]MUG98504.1 hypothetical protein [Scytonema sp. UIC 10036]
MSARQASQRSPVTTRKPRKVGVAIETCFLGATPLAAISSGTLRERHLLCMKETLLTGQLRGILLIMS